MADCAAGNEAIRKLNSGPGRTPCQDRRRGRWRYRKAHGAENSAVATPRVRTGRPVAIKKRTWFKRWGWIYLPVSVAGWLAVVSTLLFCLNSFLTVDRHSHSASDTLYGIFPYWVPALGVLLWIASRTSKKAP